MKLKKSLLKRIVYAAIITPLLLFLLMVVVLTFLQDRIVQELVATANKDFEGMIEVRDSHISPFSNFPHVSIDLEQVKVFEDKSQASPPLLSIADVYLGFSLFDVLSGNMVIKSIKLSDGSIKLIQHVDGTLNIANALSGKEEIEDTGEEFHMDIRSIELVNLDILKINEANEITIEAFVQEARSRFRSDTEHVRVFLDSRFEMNVIKGSDTTFVRHKHFDVHTELEYSKSTQVLTIIPSEFKLENAFFGMDGTIDLDDDLNMDVKFHGNKPNFDLFMAFAPAELAPVLERYDNAGKIFFEASVSGKAANGNYPLVVADFGCEDAFFDNKLTHKRLDQLFFKGHFTTGAAGDASTMEFSLTDFSARPEAGTFSGDLLVKNFASPEIDMTLRSEFQLEFLAQFLNIENLQDMKGSVALTMNFHDIVDLANPEKSIERLNESYFTELEVKDLSFKSTDYHLPVDDLDIKATMDGHAASITQFDLRMGNSNVSIQAEISDLPAILHHSAIPVTADLAITSDLLDIRELTSSDTLKHKPVDEQISNLKMKLRFNSSARAFTESPNLPVGEFFIEDMYARLKHYPHTLHDFHADVYVDSLDFRVVDFTGMIDESDFHFTGLLRNYDLWFLTQPQGSTRVEFNLTSNLLQLEDLFSYGGENYVPEDYRHEEFKALRIYGFTELKFDKGLKSMDATFDRVEAQMKVHPLRFENFKGRVHYEDNHLVVTDLGGKLGKSVFSTDLHYYLGPDSVVAKRDNHFAIRSAYLDFDELFNYNSSPTEMKTPEQHEAGFNLYEVPFSNMTFDFDIGHLRYHRYLLDNFHARARTTKNHFLYVDTLSLDAAGGSIQLKGYFNGSDPKKIYFSPVMKFAHIDLDKLLFKFENFGQDHLVSENLHGKLSGTLTGKVHMHADMTPIIDDSEIHLDIQVTEGSLVHYKALDAMADYFKDKNLDRVRFDTLSNRIDIVNGSMSIPAMTINSTLGFIELSGKQDMNLNMEYYVRIPWKLVTQAAASKLFGSGGNGGSNTQEDEIQYRDESRRQRFVNIKVSGTPENYKISLARDKNK